MRSEDPRLAEARATSIMATAEKLGITGDLKRFGAEWAGPCPECGGTDRFSIAPERGVYNCRTCGGGDVIALVQLVLSLDFKEALSWLVGDLDAEISPEEQRRRDRQAAENKQRQAEIAARKRQGAMAAAREIWTQGKPPASSDVESYLAGRGLSPELLTMPAALRFHPALPYMVSDGGDRWREVHRGPAMLAAVKAPDGQLTAIHRTWLDPERPGKKAMLEDKGKALAAKKVLGSMKGAAIRLSPHACTPDGFTTLIMGEGIETTLSAMVADVVPGAAYWAGISLPNMSGRRITRGEGMLYAGVPDLADDEAFMPPPWVRRLIFIQDGDSEAKATRAKLLAGLRRAIHYQPKLEAQIVHAGEGVDLNDVLRGDDA